MQQPPDPSRPRKRIRSYVLRPGRTTPAQARALDALWPQFGIDPQPGRLDLDRIFGRSAPRLVEVGFGTGEALLSHAIAHPEVDHVGIEVHAPGVGRLLNAIGEAGLRNVRVVRHDAVEVFEHWLTPASIHVVHVFFPDPWPKKRHHKRRLIQPSFLDLLARVLASDGIVRLATDWEPYAREMRTMFDAQPAFRNLAGDAGFVARPHDRPATRFERRGMRLGHEVWDLAYCRR